MKKNQNIDKLIQDINSITSNRCSLLDTDVKLLNEAVVELKKLKQEPERNNEAALIKIFKVVELLLKFFVITDEIEKIVEIFK